MEPDTLHDIHDNCDALVNNRTPLFKLLDDIDLFEATVNEDLADSLIISPMYACAIARLKYAMDPNPLPPHNEIFEIYRYYKRIYNSASGASTFDKFKAAWKSNSLDKINLD